jgi:hypothetical protein
MEEEREEGTRGSVKKGLEIAGKASWGLGKVGYSLVKPSGPPRFRMAPTHVGNHDDSIDKRKMGMYMPTHMRRFNKPGGIRRPRLF